jgi:choline dehydrogenase-like flavoprotein
MRAMHVDLEQVEAGAVAEAEVCVLGGGIAGLILARRLAAGGKRVMLLEAGGLEFEERSQALYAAEMTAENHRGSNEGRFRTFGGSSTRWGGQLMSLTADIFSPPAGSTGVPWPIGEEAITPYYSQVQEIFQLGTLPFTGALLPALGHPAVALTPKLRLRYSKWSPFKRRNLANTVGRECIENAQITVYTHANVVSLAGAGGRVTHARVLDYGGREFMFRAERFVVCCGTVESSRLLLNSPAVRNAHDQVGRYFHDHVALHAAILPPAALERISKRLGPFFAQGVLYTCKIEATPELQQEAGMVAVMAHFIVQEPEDSGIGAVRNLLFSLQQGKLKDAMMKNLLPMLRGTGDVVRLLWASKVRKRRGISKRATVRMNIEMEQRANAENRVRLSGELDALGLPRTVVDWRIGDSEYASAAKFARILQKEFAAEGFPELDWTPELLADGKPAMVDVYHAMGGLRMGTDPAVSVVDADLKVHGMQNLYVASCAVFPSGGSSNPTFTLMALTMRLADHLLKA